MRQTSFKHGDNSCKQQQQEQWQRVGGAEVALQGGAKFHVVATRVSRCITPVAKPGAGAAAALRVFPTTTAAPTLHYISAGQHKHTQTHTTADVLFVSLRSGFRLAAHKIIKMGENTQRDGGRETNNKQNSKNII